MSKIESIEQFKLVKESNLGFIVSSENASHIIHQSKCDSITENRFADNDEGYHWFSTIGMAKKSFSITVCDACRPSD